MRFIFILTLFFSLMACDSLSLGDKPTSNRVNRNYFPNVILVKEFGDTLRVEIEKTYYGLIKHYIDLKVKKYVGFDNSFNEICTYEEIKNDTTINSTFYTWAGDYQFYFEQEAVIAYCDSMIKNLTSDYEINDPKLYYINLKKDILDNKRKINFNEGLELIQKFNCKIINQKTCEKPKSILIEFYTTEFSGGKNFYLIMNKGDTVSFFHHRDYIH